MLSELTEPNELCLLFSDNKYTSGHGASLSVQNDAESKEDAPTKAQDITPVLYGPSSLVKELETQAKNFSTSVCFNRFTGMKI